MTRRTADRTPHPWSSGSIPWIPLLLLLLVAPARAQSGGPWSIVSSTLDGGGLQSAYGGSYSLFGTTGQPDAGILSGGVYRLDGGFWRRGIQVTDAPDPPTTPITRFAVFSPFPNPTTRACAFSFDLPDERFTSVQVLDVNGRITRTLLSDIRPAGRHVVRWDGIDAAGIAAAQGLYFVRVQAGAELGHSRVVLMGDSGGNR